MKVFRSLHANCSEQTLCSDGTTAKKAVDILEIKKGDVLLWRLAIIKVADRHAVVLRRKGRILSLPISPE